MKRWIDKMITRHLEPEHNVRPFSGGVFHAVSGEPPAFADERMNGSDEGKSGEGKIGTDIKKVWGNEKEHVLQSEEKMVKREGKEMKNERSGPEGERTIPGTYKGKGVEDNKELLSGAWKTRKGVERVVKGEESIPADEIRRLDADETRLKNVPLMQDKVRAQVETKIKYVTGEAPVLQDPGENEQRGIRQMPGQGRAEMSVPGIVKGDPPVKQAIHVSIGRIEIKATLPPAEIKAAPVKKDKDIMGLDKYLEQRNPAKQ